MTNLKKMLLVIMSVMATSSVNGMEQNLHAATYMHDIEVCKTIMDDKTFLEVISEGSPALDESNYYLYDDDYNMIIGQTRQYEGQGKKIFKKLVLHLIGRIITERHEHQRAYLNSRNQSINEINEWQRLENERIFGCDLFSNFMPGTNIF